MKTYKTTKGYHYKVYKNGKKKRISKREFDKIGDEVKKVKKVKEVKKVKKDRKNVRNNSSLTHIIHGADSNNNNNCVNAKEFLNNDDNNNNFVNAQEEFKAITIDELLQSSDKLTFTTLYNYIKNLQFIHNISVFKQVIDKYIHECTKHILLSDSGIEYEIEFGESIGSGSYGTVYPIKDTNVCVKFTMLYPRMNNRNAKKNNNNMSRYLNFKDKHHYLLPVKELYLNNGDRTYKGKEGSRLRVYLMKRCEYTLQDLSIGKISKIGYIVTRPSYLINILNILMFQISTLQYKSADLSIIISHNKTEINPVQFFDLKIQDCGCDISEFQKIYLLDLDGYYIIRTNDENYWASTIIPIEFYKEKKFTDSRLIHAYDFIPLINSYPNYYKHGLHSSWMLGILIYQMINLYCNLYCNLSNSNLFFDFLDPTLHKLTECTNDNNLFTSLDIFVGSLDEMNREIWTTTMTNDKSFLDEIKSCLYFDNNFCYDGVAGDGESKLMNWSIGQLSERRQFYNDDGSVNYFPLK